MHWREDTSTARNLCAIDSFTLQGLEHGTSEMGSQIVNFFSRGNIYISKYHETGEGRVKESLPPNFVPDCVLCLFHALLDSVLSLYIS